MGCPGCGMMHGGHNRHIQMTWQPSELVCVGMNTGRGEYGESQMNQRHDLPLLGVA